MVKPFDAVIVYNVYSGLHCRHFLLFSAFLMAEIDLEEIDIERWDDEKIKNPDEHEIIELEV